MAPQDDLKDKTKTGYWILKYNKLEQQLQWQIPLTAILGFCAGVAFHSQHVEKQLKKQKQTSEYVESQKEIVQNQTTIFVDTQKVQMPVLFCTARATKYSPSE